MIRFTLGIPHHRILCRPLTFRLEAENPAHGPQNSFHQIGLLFLPSRTNTRSTELCVLNGFSLFVFLFNFSGRERQTKLAIAQSLSHHKDRPRQQKLRRLSPPQRGTQNFSKLLLRPMGGKTLNKQQNVRENKFYNT